MAGSATVSGGIKHGSVALSHNERVVAQKVLDKLNGTRGGLRLHGHEQTANATVFGGAKSARLGAPSLSHGNDTLASGARGLASHALSHIGNDTVVSGSAASRAMHSDNHTDRSAISLKADTINIKGATAESVASGHIDNKIATGHTITFGDKTKVTVTGVAAHDVKITH